MGGAWASSNSPNKTGDPWGASSSEPTLDGKSNATSMDKLGSHNSVMKSNTVLTSADQTTTTPKTPVPAKHIGGRSGLTRHDIDDYGTSDPEYGARKKRFLLRLVQFFASGACLSFLVSAAPFSKLKTIPYENPSIIYYEYVAASISALWSFICLMSLALRSIFSTKKLNRWLLVISDAIVTMLWIVFLVVMLKTPACYSEGDRGWCAFFYTSIAFAFIAAFCSSVDFLWSVFGSCCQS